jgi:transposase
LFDKPRSGRPETHGPSARLAIIAVATSVPPEGESLWSQREIAGHLRERGLAISAATVGRVPAEAKLRPHKVRGWLNRADDPAFWARAGAACRLYLNPPPGTVLVSVDEKTGIQAKSRKHPEIPARTGRDARREFEYVRHGTVSIIAAMNVTTGEVIAEPITRDDSQTFTAFLSMLHQMIPPRLRICLIMDNGPARATRAWLAARPRFPVTYTPKHASWLNMIEQWFGVLTRRLLRRGDFASRDDLEAKIAAFAIRHNKNARPYKRSYDANAEHARYLQRHPRPEPVTLLPEAA